MKQKTKIEVYYELLFHKDITDVSYESGLLGIALLASRYDDYIAKKMVSYIENFINRYLPNLGYMDILRLAGYYMIKGDLVRLSSLEHRLLELADNNEDILKSDLAKYQDPTSIFNSINPESKIIKELFVWNTLS